MAMAAAAMTIELEILLRNVAWLLTNVPKRDEPTQPFVDDKSLDSLSESVRCDNEFSSLP